MLTMVGVSYFMLKRSLYKYARFKFFFTTMLLAINYSLLGYGGYIIAELPTEFDDDSLSK